MARSLLLPGLLALLLSAASVQAQYYPAGSVGSEYGAGTPAPSPTMPAAAPTPLPAPFFTTPASPAPAATTAGAPPTGQTIRIDPWTLPGGAVPPFGTRTAKVGDSALFVFQGLHGLFQIPDGTCPQTFTDAPPLKQISAPTNNGQATVPFTAPGTYWFACPVPGHCSLGMLIKFVVT